jgi:hypothetical protein
MMQFLKTGTLQTMALLVFILGLTTACSTKSEKIETLGSKLRQECFQYAEKISKKLPILVDDKALWTSTTCQYGTTIKPVLTYIYEIKNAQKFTQLEINTEVTSDINLGYKLVTRCTIQKRNVSHVTSHILRRV